MTSLHPFRFGLFAEHLLTPTDLIGTARRAEALGFATLLIRDHFIEEPFGHQLAPIAALATVAAHTERLRFGTLVFANDYRSPVLLAKETATLDLLSGGRFEFGIGTGFTQEEYGLAGIPFDRPGVRVDRFAEALRVFKGIWADAPLTFVGEHYTLTAYESYPKPVQRPHPPILVGAGGKRMLTIAGREADIVGLLSVATGGGVVTDDPHERTAATIQRKIGWVREGAGERFSEIELSTTGTIIPTDDRREAAATMIRERGWNDVSVDDVLAMPGLFFGSIAQIIEQMRARRELYGLSYYVLSDAAMEIAAPIVAALAGT
jgi:probable F420-dependent oxidoreductase